MFFFKKKAVEQVVDKERLERVASLSQRIKEKLEEIKSTNHVLSETVEHTQAANVKLALKLKKHLKSGNRSFASLSDKLNVGVIIVNHEGCIIQENPRARDFLGCDITCEGLSLFDRILEIQPVEPPGQKLVLAPEFFSRLSECISSTMTKCKLAEDEVCNHCINALPCSLIPDEEQLVDIKITGSEETHRLKFTFSILNNPEEKDDIAYVIVFRKGKKTKAEA
jgi:hypothetical protein